MSTAICRFATRCLLTLLLVALAPACLLEPEDDLAEHAAASTVPEMCTTDDVTDNIGKLLDKLKNKCGDPCAAAAGAQQQARQCILDHADKNGDGALTPKEVGDFIYSLLNILERRFADCAAIGQQIVDMGDDGSEGDITVPPGNGDGKLQPGELDGVLDAACDFVNPPET